MKRLSITLAFFAASCGASSPTAPATPAPQTLNFSPIVSGAGYVLQDVTIFQTPAQVTATLRWTDGRKDLDLFWTNALCSITNGSFTGTGCLIINRSVSTTGTLESVSGPAAAGSTVRLFIVNYSSASEGTTLSVTLSP